MRSAILGVFADNVDQISELVRITTRITHTDPKAEMGAFAIALAAHCAKSGESVGPHEYLSRLKVGLRCEGSSDFLVLIQRAVESVQNNCETEQFATELGLSKGVSGYVCHCVPVVIPRLGVLFWRGICFFCRSYCFTGSVGSFRLIEETAMRIPVIRGLFDRRNLVNADKLHGGMM